MSKLSETTNRVRKYVIFFFVFSIIVILIQNIYQYIKNSEQFKPKVDYYATVDNAFGKIEYPNISTLLLADGSTPQFVTNGKFSEMPSSVLVYKVDKPRETFSSAVIAEDLAQKLGFTSKYTKDGNYMIWREDGKLLRYDVVTRNAFFVNENLHLESKSTIVNDLKKVIDKAFGNIIKDLSFNSAGYYETYYLQDTGNGFKLVNNLEISDYIRRDYRQSFKIVAIRSIYKDTDTPSDVQEISGKLYMDHPYEGNFYLTVHKNALFGSELQSIKEFGRLGYSVDEENFGVYKLKQIEVAWDDVKKGKGYLKFLGNESDIFMSYSPISVKRFVLDIDKSELAFFMPNEWTGYIYPIYVFRGIAQLDDNRSVNFVFYAKAIED